MNILNSCCHFVLAAGCANVVDDDSRLLAIARFTHFRGFEHAMCQKRPCCYTSQNECGIPDLRRNEPMKTLSLGWEPCSLQIFCVYIYIYIYLYRERENHPFQKNTCTFTFKSRYYFDIRVPRIIFVWNRFIFHLHVWRSSTSGTSRMCLTTIYDIVWYTRQRYLEKHPAGWKQCPLGSCGLSQ